MPETTPFPPPYRRRRPRRRQRLAPSPRLRRRLDWAIKELESWILVLYAPKGRRELLELEDPVKIAAALSFARRAAARETRADWLPAWPEGTQISNHDAEPLVKRAYKTLQQIKDMYEMRGAR